MAIDKIYSHIAQSAVVNLPKFVDTIEGILKDEGKISKLAIRDVVVVCLKDFFNEQVDVDSPVALEISGYYVDQKVRSGGYRDLAGYLVLDSVTPVEA